VLLVQGLEPLVLLVQELPALVVLVLLVRRGRLEPQA
jgi:hypothetical protein|tara:strand:+ start:554 stop:664 length:111 start_codon:yes stop_codon:yes gene_type:complete